MAQVRVQHLSKGVILPEQTRCLGLIVAGEHSFQLSPKGSKALKSSDLRGQAKFKMLTSFPRPCVSR